MNHFLTVFLSAQKFFSFWWRKTYNKTNENQKWKKFQLEVQPAV